MWRASLRGLTLDGSGSDKEGDEHEDPSFAGSVNSSSVGSGGDLFCDNGDSAAGSAATSGPGEAEGATSDDDTSRATAKS